MARLTLLLALLLSLAVACDDGDNPTDGDADGDSDGDADGDSDGDADGDSDGDADGDSDGDADGDAPEDLADFLEPIRVENEVPALAAAVINGDELVALGAVGLRKVDDDTATTPDDLFHLGSDTKAMTATLLAVLVEEGFLDWDTTLAEAFPDLATDCLDAAFADVTLAQVLAHRGGLTGNLAVDFSELWNGLWLDARPVDEQRADIAATLLCEPPTIEPGSAELYSNAGYIIVGAAMEAATGEAWEDLMQDRLFTPLEMTDCGFGPPATAGTVDQPWGHSVTDGAVVPVDPGVLGADNPVALGPAGTVHCSMTSWARFASAHVLGGQGDESFLPAAAWTHMHTPAEGEDYAFGWGFDSETSWSAGPVLQHAGSNTMFFAFILIAPGSGFGYLTAMNIGDARASATVIDVHTGLIDLYAEE